MHRARWIGLGLVALALLPAAGWAGEPTVADIELGKHIFGESLVEEDLQGRTVLLYFWDAG